MKINNKNLFLALCFLLSSITTYEAQGQSCVDLCVDRLYGCNLGARIDWMACWLECTFTWGDESWEYEYDLSHNYYSDACKDQCDWLYDWELAYCDLYYDQCLDYCADREDRDSSGG